MTYLDHNATTPVRPEVVDAMIPWLRAGFGNPSSVHSLGQRARAAVERAREQVAAVIGACDPSEIVFTSCGSEADVLAVAGGAWQGHDESGGRRRKVVTSVIEHDALRLLARGEADTRRHITGEIPLDTIVSGGFVPLVEKKADHIKIHVIPEEGGS